MLPLIDLAPFRNRSGFGPFLRGKGLHGQAAEIGTHQGEFALILLRRWPGFLNLIDPWGVPAGYESQAQDLQRLYGTSNRNLDLQKCYRNLDRYKHRVLYHRTVSLQAAVKFTKDSLDFVYLDGDHREFMVQVDLEAWWSKVRPSGILAGHDILCINEPNGGWGSEVQAAVFPFAAKHNLTVNLVMEEDNSPWSFYLEKLK